MAYTKTTWLDRVVQFANRYTKSGETSSEVTLVQSPGTVTQAGSAVNAALLNKIEQGIADAHVTADAALPKAGGTMTGTLNVPTIAGVTSTALVTNLNADRVDGFHIRKLGNAYQISADGVTWENMGNLVDKSAAVPFNVINNTSFALTTAYQTVLSITGKKGYLDEFSMYLAAGSVRITFDGSIKYDISLVSGGYVTISRRDDFLLAAPPYLGFLIPDNANFNYGSFQTGYIEVAYGYSGSINSSVFSMLADSIYFNTSLLIEAKVTTGTSTAKYRLSGGSY